MDVDNVPSPITVGFSITPLPIGTPTYPSALVFCNPSRAEDVSRWDQNACLGDCSQLQSERGKSWHHGGGVGTK